MGWPWKKPEINIWDAIETWLRSQDWTKPCEHGSPCRWSCKLCEGRFRRLNALGAGG